MKRYELDLTNCELPEFWGDLPLIIPAVEGEHMLDFDVVDERINEIAFKIPQVLGNSKLPIGFDIRNIPVGAIFRRLKDD